MSQKYDNSSNHETSTIDMIMLFSMPIAIAALLGVIGYLGAAL